MTKIYFFLFFLVFAFNPIVTAQEKPNILFIFADDLTVDAIGALSNNEVKTPNLDRLVANGTLFTHAFNQGSWTPAVCAASRAMLNSGSFLWEAHQQSFRKNKSNYVTPWSIQMKNAGYTTYMTGKWHVNANANDLFDVAKDIRPGMPNQTKERYNRTFNKGEKDSWSPYDKSNQGYWKGGKHWSEIIGDNTISFIDEASKKEQPFFMYIAFNAPHDPRQSPKEFVDMYPPNSIKIPKNFIPEYPYAEAMGSGKNLRDEKLAPFPRTPNSVQVNRQEYYAIITHMDVQIGRILDALESTEKADNTYIIFTADHGLAIGEHGLIGKQNMYDSSIRVPLIITGKGIKKGYQTAAFIYLQDVMATSLALADAPKPTSLDYKSLLPLASGKTNKGNYKNMYGAYLDKQRMIRTKTHKMILYPSIKKLRLYDLKNDPNEMFDIAENKTSKRIIKKLFKQFQKLQKQTSDPLVIDYIEKYTK
ncbi:MAG: choline-sulfatase [Flavobacteriaceae bacterium]|nr:MAG: choline-sulfatase [Flavobacteriaceae bacterium]